MRALAFVLALLAGAAQAQTVTLRKWQDMAALVDRQDRQQERALRIPVQGCLLGWVPVQELRPVHPYSYRSLAPAWCSLP